MVELLGALPVHFFQVVVDEEELLDAHRMNELEGAQHIGADQIGIRLARYAEYFQQQERIQ